jgi:hypothetical protein
MVCLNSPYKFMETDAMYLFFFIFFVIWYLPNPPPPSHVIPPAEGYQMRKGGTNKVYSARIAYAEGVRVSSTEK